MENNKQLPDAYPDGHDHHISPHLLSKRFMTHANQPGYMGSLSSANGYAKGVGVCGDAIAIYLSVSSDQIIRDIRHDPKGCTYTVACGSALAHLVFGRTLSQALKISPEDIAAELNGLPEDHMHCASLAVNTLGEAVDDYYQKIWGNRKTSEKKQPVTSP